MSNHKPDGVPPRQKIRPAVVAGTVLAVVGAVGAAPAAAYVRNETTFGVHTFGDPGLIWGGGSFPPAPTATVPRYRVVPTPVIHLSAAAREHLHLEATRNLKDENGTPYTFPAGTFQSYPRWGTTAVWYSRTDVDAGGHSVGARQAIAAVRALFEDDLQLHVDDWHFEVGSPWGWRRPTGTQAETYVLVRPMAEGKRVTQYGGYVLGGYVRVDSRGIRAADLSLGTLVRDGTTRVESAAEAWDRGRHHRGFPDDDDTSNPRIKVTFTKAVLGTQFPPGRKGRPTYSVPSWTFTDPDGLSITVSAGS